MGDESGKDGELAKLEGEVSIVQWRLQCIGKSPCCSQLLGVVDMLGSDSDVKSYISPLRCWRTLLVEQL